MGQPQLNEHDQSWSYLLVCSDSPTSVSDPPLALSRSTPGSPRSASSPTSPATTQPTRAPRSAPPRPERTSAHLTEPRCRSADERPARRRIPAPLGLLGGHMRTRALVLG